MFTALTVKQKAIAAALVAAFLFGAGWKVQGWRMSEQMAQLQKEHAEQIARNAAAALHRYTEMERQKDEAIQTHAKQAAENQRDADAAKRITDGLRRDLAGVQARIDAAAEAAVREYATAVSVVFDHCTASYSELAAKAQGHATDVRLMQDAWPK